MTDSESDNAGETAAHDQHTHDEHTDHDHHHHDVDDLSIAVVTVSSSRSLDEDSSGDHAIELIEAEGHEVPTREVVNDDYDGVQSAVNALVRRDDVDAVITSGGTGVTPDDITVEAIKPLFEKELPGFGELFRRRSEDEIGTRVVGSRATAGIARQTPVFCLPGSENAVLLGVEEIILPEAPHLVGLAQRES